MRRGLKDGRSFETRASRLGPELVLATNEGQSSHLLRALCLLATRSERLHPQGSWRPVELAGDSDFLAHFWRIRAIEMAC